MDDLGVLFRGSCHFVPSGPYSRLIDALESSCPHLDALASFLQWRGSYKFQYHPSRKWFANVRDIWSFYIYFPISHHRDFRCNDSVLK